MQFKKYWLYTEKLCGMTKMPIAIIVLIHIWNGVYTTPERYIYYNYSVSAKQVVGSI